MLDTLGPLGIAGFVAFFAGLTVIAWVDLTLAAGIALLIAGLGLVVRALVTSLLQSMGLGSML